MIRAAWALIAAAIVAGSAGEWSLYEPGVWAPLLVSPGDVARNIALYVPFGMLGLLALGRPGPRGVARVTAVAVLFSAMIEAAQLYTTDRVASLTDVASAGAGAAIGAVLVVALVAGAR